jgi:hypothetical protein
MKKYILFFLISLTIFVAHAVYAKHAIYGDGNGYYVTAQSLLYDHTFKSNRILSHLKNFQGRDYIFSRVFWDESKNPYSVGTSLTWLPALAVTSIFSDDPTDLFHEVCVGITGILFIIFGLYFLDKYLRNFYDKDVVDITIISLFFASNLLYYSSFEPALSHQPSFFLISFCLYWTHKLKHSAINLFLMGLLFGLVYITRISDTLLLIPILFTLKLDFANLFYLVLGFSTGIVPQIAAQYYYYGSILRNFYVTESSNQWSFQLVHLLEYLFSYQKGLFVWSPIYLIGVFGLIKIRKYLILATLFSLWCLGAFWSTHSAMTAGFGQRLSFAAIPYFALGIAPIYDQHMHRSRLVYLTIFSVWNFFLLYGFYVFKWKNLS